MDDLTSQSCLQAQELLKTGRLQEAFDLFQSAYRSASDPADRALVTTGLGDCLWAMGRKEEARSILHEAHREIPEDHFVRLELEFLEACWYWEEKKFKEAGQVLDRLLPRSRAHIDTPEGRELYGDIQVKRGILLTSFQRPCDACPILEEALAFELSPEQKGDVLYNPAVCYYDLDRKDLAKEKFQASLDAGVQKYWAVRAHHYLGLIHSENHAYAWAKQEFEFSESHANEVALPRKPTLEMLSHCCRRLGFYDEANRYKALADQI